MRTKFLFVALFATFFGGVASLRAQPTIASIQTEFLDAQNELLTAAVDFETAVTNSGNQATTVADINSALTNLTAISEAMTNASIQTALGRKYPSLERQVSNHIVLADKKIQKALEAVDALSGRTETEYVKDNVIGPVTYSQRKAVIVAMEGAANGVLSAGLVLGKPLIANRSPSTAGFYNPGGEASFQIDTAGCDETPVVMVQNASPFSSPIDTQSAVYDTETGVLKFKMGTDSGGGSVTVAACGQTSTLLVYNYGKTPVAGVPLDFPQTLPSGKYLMTYSASGAASIPTTALGYYNLSSAGLKAFYNNISRAFSTAINSVSEPGCTQGVSYSPFTDNSFTVSYTVTCTSDGQSASETLNFTLTKQ